ncbi:type II toxin-antitoxin system VapC family toxin [Nocardioides sp. CCNWLW239]|uniref:type II toxin-antitoxin system VapC family toxin n=1 Tax=Nocardioides sp. CCNWLW239 TaxID=3128902 RepID=UPI003015D213
MTYLLDTHVVSEVRRKRPDQAVVRWLAAQRDDDLYVSVLTIGELRKGALKLAARGDAVAGSLLEWIDGVEQDYQERLLPVTVDVAKRWGDLNADRPLPVIDSLLAATAMENGLTVATRNTKDFELTAVAVHNPFSDA